MKAIITDALEANREYVTNYIAVKLPMLLYFEVLHLISPMLVKSTSFLFEASKVCRGNRYDDYADDGSWYESTKD